MRARRLLHSFIVAVLLGTSGTSLVPAQSGRMPAPRPEVQEPSDEVRIRTEEVRVPVFARDEFGRFDPTLVADDLVVLEDNVPQKIQSLRRLPASVLLLLSVGGELNPAQRTNTTRQAALAVAAALRPEDAVAVMQFDTRIELLQGWTTDALAAMHAIRAKLHSGRGARPAEALQQAARLFANQPVGNRHIVLVTDAVDTPAQVSSPGELTRMLSSDDANAFAGRLGFAEAMRQVQAAQVTVHAISYTAYGRKEAKDRAKKPSSAAPPGSVRASGIPTSGIDPTMPPTMNRGGAIGPSTGAPITVDPAMRRLRKAYEKAMQRGEQRLQTLTAETGGRVFLPQSDDELIAQGTEVAREIGTQYIVTYRPQRPLADAPATEYRRLTVLPRRGGLTLRARRGYVAGAALNPPTPPPGRG